MIFPDVQLSTAEVRQHAHMVDQAADMCRDAAAGAEHIDLHDEVYGKLYGWFIVSRMNPRQRSALAAIRNRAQATNDLADLLRVVADNLEAADRRADQRHREAGR